MPYRLPLPHLTQNKLRLMWEKLKADKGFDCDFLDWVRDRREQAGMIRFDDVGVVEVLNLGLELYALIGEGAFPFRVRALSDRLSDNYWADNKNWERESEAQVFDWLAEMCAERGDWLERKCG